METAANKLQKEAKGYLDSLRAMTASQMRIAETIEELRRERFRFAGASAGSVHVHECPTQLELKHLADTRMYEEKRRRRPSVQAEWARDSSRPPAPASRSSPPPANPPEPTSPPHPQTR